MAFAFDLASAQFSHFRTVTPWTEYEAKLVSRVMSVRPFGVTVKRMARDFDGGGFAMWGLISGNSHAARVALTHKVYAEKLDKQVQTWLTDEPESLTSLLGADLLICRSIAKMSSARRKSYKHTHCTHPLHASFPFTQDACAFQARKADPCMPHTRKG